MKNERYSFPRLIAALLDDNPKTYENSPEMKFSREVLEPEHGRPARFGGAFVPLRPVALGLDSKSNAAGGFLEQSTLGSKIIDAVRAQSHLLALGAQTFTPGPGSLQIAVAESGNQCRWIGENLGVDGAQTDAVFSGRWMKPHALLTSWTVSRQLLGQASGNLEQFLIDDIGRAIAAEIDRAGIQGSGELGEPIGMLSTAVAIPIVSIDANGAVPTADTVEAMEEAVSLAKFTGTGFLTTPSLRRRFRKVPSIVGGSVPVWCDDADDPGGSSMLGYSARVSTNVPSTLAKGTGSNLHGIIHGDFTQLVVPVWDLEVVRDQFSKKKQGLIELSIYTSCDIGVVRPTAFALCLDAMV